MSDKDYLDIIKFLKAQGLEYEASIIEDLSKENTALKQQLDISVEALEEFIEDFSGFDEF